MRYDRNWADLYFPDFSPYAGLNPLEGIMLMSADMFAPDGEFPAEVKEALHQAVERNMLYYTPGSVERDFETVVSKKLKDFNNLELGPSRQLLIVPGSAFGLFLSIRTCVNPNCGEGVINFTPTFAENINDVVMMGAKNIFCPLRADDDYRINIDDLEACVTPDTKCLVLTHPANPIGTIHDRETLTALAEFLIRHDLIAIVDQCFERYVYDGREYITLASLPGMEHRVLTVFGPSKELRLSGLRVGYVVGPPDLISKMQVATYNYVGKTSVLGLVACTAAYEHLEYTREWLDILDRRRKLGQQILNGIPGVSCPLPEAGYSFWLDVRELGSSDQIVEYLVREAQVGVGNGNWFGTNCDGFLRVMFACYRDDEKILTAFNRIADALGKYRAVR